MQQALHLTVDDQSFGLCFEAWDKPLRVLQPEGELRPWCMAQHLSLLAQSARGGPDPEQLADAVLAVCWSGAASPDLRPLALWWAAGGEGTPEFVPSPPLRLRPWGFGERAAAMAQAGAFADPPALDLALYLGAMVRASVVGLDEDALGQLPAGPLMAAVLAINTPEVQDLPPALRETVRRLCEILRWTPRQVMQAPARDMDDALALLPPGPRGAEADPPRGLMAHPDTTVIWFGG